MVDMRDENNNKEYASYSILYKSESTINAPIYLNIVVLLKTLLPDITLVLKTMTMIKQHFIVQNLIQVHGGIMYVIAQLYMVAMVLIIVWGLYGSHGKVLYYSLQFVEMKLCCS